MCSDRQRFFWVNCSDISEVKVINLGEAESQAWFGSASSGMGYWRAANEVLHRRVLRKGQSSWNMKRKVWCTMWRYGTFCKLSSGAKSWKPLRVSTLWIIVKTCFQAAFLFHMFSGPLRKCSYIQLSTFLDLPCSKDISCTDCTPDHHSASIHEHYDVCIYLVLYRSLDSFTPPHFAGAHSGPVHALAVPDREDIVHYCKCHEDDIEIKWRELENLKNAWRSMKIVHAATTESHFCWVLPWFHVFSSPGIWKDSLHFPAVGFSGGIDGDIYAFELRRP